jgi:hypothetical protein
MWKFNRCNNKQKNKKTKNKNLIWIIFFLFLESSGYMLTPGELLIAGIALTVFVSRSATGRAALKKSGRALNEFWKEVQREEGAAAASRPANSQATRPYKEVDGSSPPPNARRAASSATEHQMADNRFDAGNRVVEQPEEAASHNQQHNERKPR